MVDCWGTGEGDVVADRSTKGEDGLPFGMFWVMGEGA